MFANFQTRIIYFGLRTLDFWTRLNIIHKPAMAVKKVDLSSESEYETGKGGKKKEKTNRMKDKTTNADDEGADQKKSANAKAKTPANTAEVSASGSYYSPSPVEEGDKKNDGDGDAPKGAGASHVGREEGETRIAPSVAATGKVPPPPPPPPPSEAEMNAREGVPEGFRCKVCNKWLKNSDSAVRAHLSNSVRCAKYRGQQGTRIPRPLCGKYIANNQFSMEPHSWHCPGVKNQDERSKQTDHGKRASRTPPRSSTSIRSRTSKRHSRSRTPISRGRSQWNAKPSRPRTPPRGPMRGRPRTPLRLEENEENQRSSHQSRREREQEGS